MDWRTFGLPAFTDASAKVLGTTSIVQVEPVDTSGLIACLSLVFASKSPELGETQTEFSWNEPTHRPTGSMSTEHGAILLDRSAKCNLCSSQMNIAHIIRYHSSHTDHTDTTRIEP